MPTPCNPARRRLLQISACAFAGSLTGGSFARELRTHHFTAHALGAGVSLAIVHTDGIAAQKMATGAFSEIKRLERFFSLYLDNSSVVELNENGKLEQPPAELLSVFSQATGVWLATEGAFDPTVQPHWNKRLDTRNRQPVFSWQDVNYSTSRIEFNKPGMAITLNGIAQGYISEQVAILLQRNGLENILVNVGEIVAVGNRSDGMPWQVGLAELQSDSAQQSIALSGTAIATSAPLHNPTDADVSVGHIIDPASGRSCESPWHRLSVIHPSAAIADGLSTGLVMKTAAGIQKAISHYPQAKVVAADLAGEQHTFVHRQ